MRQRAYQCCANRCCATLFEQLDCDKIGLSSNNLYENASSMVTKGSKHDGMVDKVEMMTPSMNHEFQLPAVPSFKQTSELS